MYIFSINQPLLNALLFSSLKYFIVLFIFQFLCYPWQDDSQVAAKDRIPICRKDKDCKEGKECYRHTDKRRVSKGLCLDKVCLCKLTLPKPKYIYFLHTRNLCIQPLLTLFIITAKRMWPRTRRWQMYRGYWLLWRSMLRKEILWAVQ